MVSTHEPVTYDIKIFCGATWRLDMSYAYGPDAPAPGPISMAGWNGRMKIRATRANGITAVVDYDTELASLTTANGGVILNADATPGRIRLFMSDATTTSLPAVPARYDLELVNTSGEVIRLIMGDALISEEVTR